MAFLSITALTSFFLVAIWTTKATGQDGCQTMTDSENGQVTCAPILDIPAASIEAASTTRTTYGPIWGIPVPTPDWQTSVVSKRDLSVAAVSPSNTCAVEVYTTTETVPPLTLTFSGTAFSQGEWTVTNTYTSTVCTARGVTDEPSAAKFTPTPHHHGPP
ncbi:uncharacterized protein JN550_008084 [Neoarthrinium moseri]|uniref:uncharacterized protein n=1 Tax=Neoarthrinium moseri TaxID=1658444 RepID=UPI001FDC6F87|nr:uncharacterized protein JN550_008084 [Neoarthrinium moseri]KAI1865826.1 hypothetical protein JN550_008084 [Neoarthrinium moseri]